MSLARGAAIRRLYGARRSFSAWLTALVGLLTAPLLHGATLPAGFTETLVASGLANPTAMAFAPDGRLFVCEQGGRLRVIKNGVLLPAPFVALAVDTFGERGLIGVAFDPDFSVNQFVYVHYTSSATTHNRISRFTANGDVAVPGSELVILELDSLYASNHNGGAIHFGLDGKLYVGVGDNATSANARTLDNLHGKMLRLNRDGSFPADNPFSASATGRNRAIWAIGLRNPFTFAVQPTTGMLFINDVGEASREEINVGVAGGDYGWPETEGDTTDPRFQAPRYSYPHSGTCAIVGAAFYEPATVRFPIEYVGDYFFADYCAGWIRTLDPAGGGNTVQGFATGITSPVDLEVCDGSLYYLARGSGSDTGVVYRVEYGASAPTITTQPASQTVRIGDAVTFSVRASGTPPLAYQWRRNGAAIAGATSPDYTMASVTQSDDGAVFRAVVTNSLGSTSSADAVLTAIFNERPTAGIVEPVQSALYIAGGIVNVSGAGTDPEDGELPPDAFTWQVDFHHDEHSHPFIQPTSGVKGGSFTIPTTGETSANVWYRIHLTVRDSGGLTHAVQRDVLPRKSRITLDSSPSGFALRLDGQLVTTPFSFDGVVGIVRNLDVVSPQTAGGVSYDFQAWSDGGESRHDIAVPLADTIYKATFAVPPAGGDQGSSTILEARFDAHAEGFVYVDDAFRGSSSPSYASGMHVLSGGFSGGGLKVVVGGVDDQIVSAMSGGWRRTFSLPEPAEVSLSFRYRLTQFPNYEGDEFSEALVAVDALQPGTGGTDYIVRLVGDGNGGDFQSTGWRQFEMNLGTLSAGPHTLTIGGHNNRKTFNDEVTELLLDDVTVASAGLSPSVLTSIAVVPASTSVPIGGTRQFGIEARDQYGNLLPADATWTASGGGTIDATGLFTASAVGGPFTVTAQVGALSATSLVTVTDAVPPAGSAIVDADFDADEEGFVYVDDPFRNSSAPGYAAGARTAGYSGGGLTVTVGGTDDQIVSGMSGGWRRSFTLPDAAQVTVSLRYRLVQAPNYESDEFSEVLVTIGSLQPGSSGTDYVARLTGDGNGGEYQSTGWRTFEATLTLPPGTHVLTIGAYSNQKTFTDEVSEVVVDDVVVR